MSDYYIRSEFIRVRSFDCFREMCCIFQSKTEFRSAVVSYCRVCWIVSRSTKVQHEKHIHSSNVALSHSLSAVFQFTFSTTHMEQFKFSQTVCARKHTEAVCNSVSQSHTTIDNNERLNEWNGACARQFDSESFLLLLLLFWFVPLRICVSIEIPMRKLCVFHVA